MLGKGTGANEDDSTPSARRKDSSAAQIRYGDKLADLAAWVDHNLGTNVGQTRWLDKSDPSRERNQSQKNKKAKAYKQ